MNNLPAITGNDASLVANTTDVWCKLLEMRGQKVSDERRLAAATILSHIVCPDTMRVSDTTLVNAYPGFGKATFDCDGLRLTGERHEAIERWLAGLEVPVVAEYQQV